MALAPNQGRLAGLPKWNNIPFHPVNTRIIAAGALWQLGFHRFGIPSKVPGRRRQFRSGNLWSQSGRITTASDELFGQSKSN